MTFPEQCPGGRSSDAKSRLEIQISLEAVFVKAALDERVEGMWKPTSEVVPSLSVLTPLCGPYPQDAWG